MSNEARFEFVLVDQSGQPTRAGTAAPPPMPTQPIPTVVETVQGPQGDRLSQTPRADPRPAPTAPRQPTPAPAPRPAPSGAPSASGAPAFSTEELAEMLGKTPEEVQQEFGLKPEETPVDRAAERQQRRQDRDEDRQRGEQQRMRESFLPRRARQALDLARRVGTATGVALGAGAGLAAGAAAAAVAAPVVAAAAGVSAAERLAPGLAEVNADVAAAMAMRDVQDVLNRIRTGETMGGATAEVINELTSIGASVTEIRNAVLGPLVEFAASMINLVEEPLEAAARLAKAINDNPELQKVLKTTLLGPGPSLFWKAIGALAEWLDNDKAKKDTSLLQWFDALEHITPFDWEGSRIMREGFTAERPGFAAGQIGAPPRGFGVADDALPMLGGGF